MKHLQAIVMFLLLALPGLAEPADDPWAQVPALPSSCYTHDDAFADQSAAAASALDSERERQEEINQAISQQSGEIDMMEQQQRMVAFMMEHPEDAQRYMEAIQQGGLQVQEQTPEIMERQGQIYAALNDLKSKYDAALRQAMAPIEAGRQQVDADAVAMNACTQESMEKRAALAGAENAAYEKLCASWWKDGPFHAWLAEFRQFQTELGAQSDENAATAKLHYEVMGIPADEYRPTGYLQAPLEYLREAGTVFGKRRYAPVSEEVGSCEGHG